MLGTNIINAEKRRKAEKKTSLSTFFHWLVITVDVSLARERIKPEALFTDVFE